MIDGKRLAIYLYLTEIEACEAKLKAFEDNPTIHRYELMFALEAALPTEVAGLLLNMMAFLDCAATKYFTEVMLLTAAREYGRFPWVDNTYRERFRSMQCYWPTSPDEVDLPF